MSLTKRIIETLNDYEKELEADKNRLQMFLNMATQERIKVIQLLSNPDANAEDIVYQLRSYYNIKV